MNRFMNRPIFCINLKNAVKILVSGFIKEVVNMKHIQKALITALIAVLAAYSLAAEDAPLSPGLQVIANQNSLVKTGIAGAELNFTSADFADGLGLEKVAKITVTSLPPREVGILKLGSLEVFEGQTISWKNLSSLRFVPTGKGELETSFGFCIGSSPFTTKYECEVFALSRVNSAPVITQPEAVTSGVFSGIDRLGSVRADDPDGDSLRFEIVSKPSHGSVTLTDESLGYYVYTPEEGYKGRDSFTLRAVDRYGAASNTVKVSLTVDTPSEEEIFSDLEGHWANSAVIACERAGIIECGEYFYPDSPMGRAEFLDFMMKAAGYTGFSTSNTGFYDDASIPEEYKGSVALADMLGVISGIEQDGKLCFCPNNQITRAEAAVIVAKLGGVQLSDSLPTSSDDSIPVWARSSMEALRYEGILRGKATASGVSLAPYEVVTRAAAAQMASAILDN